jgi:hypothetical protein
MYTWPLLMRSGHFFMKLKAMITLSYKFLHKAATFEEHFLSICHLPLFLLPHFLPWLLQILSKRGWECCAKKNGKQTKIKINHL